MGMLGVFASGPGQTFTISIFVDHIIGDLGLSRTLISGLYTAGSLIAASLLVFVGILLDRLGARVMLFIVAALFGLAALWMSTVDNPPELLIGFAALRLLGAGSLTMIPVTLLAIWFIRLRGRAMIFNTLGMSLAVASFPPLTHFLISTVGWRDAWLILAAVTWGLVLIPAALLTRRSPESVGLLPDAERVRTVEKDPDHQIPRRRETDFRLGEASRTWAFWLLLLAGAAQPLISTALAFHQISLLTGKGMSPGLAAMVFSVQAPMSVVGSFITGFMANKVPNRFSLIAGLVLLTTTMLFTLIISEVWHAFLYGGMLGLAGGIIVTTNGFIWPNYFGRRHLGSIKGVVAASSIACTALGPLPFGALFDLTGSYTIAIRIFLIMPAICAVAAFLARPPKKIEPSQNTRSLDAHLPLS
jgi:MFS family permease